MTYPEKCPKCRGNGEYQDNGGFWIACRPCKTTGYLNPEPPPRTVADADSDRAASIWLSRRFRDPR